MLEGTAERVDQYIRNVGAERRVFVNVQSGPDYDPVLTPEYITPDPFVAEGSFAVQETTGGLVKQGDRLFFISAATPITPQHKVEVDGVKYNIEVLRTVATGDSVFVYRAQCRQ